MPNGQKQPSINLPGEFCAVSRLVAGGAVGDYNNDGLQDIFITSQAGQSTTNYESKWRSIWIPYAQGCDLS